MLRKLQLSLAIALMTLLALATLVPVHHASAAPEKKATFEVYKDKAGEYRWRLRATNSNVIAASGEGYKEKRSCLSAIESVKKDAPEAPIEEEAAK